MSLFSAPPPPARQPPDAEPLPPLPPPGTPEFAPAETGADAAAPASPLVEPEPPTAEAAPPPPPQPWQEELSERVESYRRRRARLHKDADTSGNLDFDFSRAEEQEEPSETDSPVLEFPRAATGVDVELGGAATPEGEWPVLEALPLERPAGERAPGSHVGEVSLAPGSPQRAPVEIVVGPPEVAATPALDGGPLILPLAPLRRRFLAGLADAGVLVVGAILFALIFWRAGGQLSPQPLNLAVLAFSALFFVFGYFALSAAFAASTPGLLWMGIEIRNLEGLPPTPREALWRGFGYLVSIAALMLGFVWALVDSEGLTWHDRMSGTYLVPTGGAEEVESQESMVES